jgi:cyclopropane-fatty-acyl-phospholipid synthase
MHYSALDSHGFLLIIYSARKASALGFDDKFIRTWEYYLSYAAALFKSRTAIDYQVRAYYISTQTYK